MKNIGLLIAVVAVVLIAAGGFYFLNSKSPSKTSPQGAKEQVKEQTQGTILGLLGLNKNVKCDITYPEGSGSGVMYFSSDKKFSGEFTIKSEGKELKGYVLSDGTYSYSWSNALNQGVKVKLDEAQKALGSDQNKGVDMNQKVNYSCSPWTVDSSKFSLPKGVTFLDMSQLLPSKAAGQTMPQGSSPCDQISDPTAKAACVSALSGK